MTVESAADLAGFYRLDEQAVPARHEPAAPAAAQDDIAVVFAAPTRARGMASGVPSRGRAATASAPASAFQTPPVEGSRLVIAGETWRVTLARRDSGVIYMELRR